MAVGQQTTQLGRSLWCGRTAAGQNDQFPPANLSGGCGFNKQTLAGAYGNDEVAPIPTFPRPWSNSRPVHRLRNELEAGVTITPIVR